MAMREIQSRSILFKTPFTYKNSQHVGYKSDTINTGFENFRENIRTEKKSFVRPGNLHPNRNTLHTIY